MLRHTWWVLGLVLLGGGVAVVLASQIGPSNFGWFAYAPLGDGSGGRISSGSLWNGSLWNGSMLIVNRRQVLGLAVAAIGLVVLAAGTGFTLGRRRA
ncbi:hypothetical protein V3G39_11115 [Dermatophilaceae bacterium Sec6.4]